MQKNKIRVATTQDAKSLVEIYAPYVEKTAITFEYTVPTVEEFAEPEGVLPLPTILALPF